MTLKIKTIVALGCAVALSLSFAASAEAAGAPAISAQHA
jgi:periplasmic copper chaperone A